MVLESLGKKVGLIGTVKNMVADESLPAKYTTPDAYELQGLFRRMVDAGCEYCVMEVSSQALAQDRVNGCNFTVAAFTNLTQDHLDYHQTWENYFAAKRKLFTMCQTAIMNVDDDNALPLVEGLDCKVIRYAVKNDDSDYTAKNLRLSADRIAYELVSVNGIGRVICPIPGRFYVYNSLCAAVCVLTLGFDYNEVLEGLRQTSGVKGRIEVVPTDTDYTVLIDYAHSPDGLQNIISSLREVSQGRIVTVFGCGGDRDRTKRPEMGRIAAQLSDYCVVTSDNPRTEEPDAIIADILEGVRREKTPYTAITSRRDAIRYALENAQTDDIILLAGKGHETYQVLRDETIHFDEREIVREILNG
ncbi:MAG: UDP-N-acetylmuramoyl-L-alanyl-D-glutamate--2,6-diaminopimelate ligase [Clostridiales bacterium]|nr:UDP-N-acetylmuramoyl-L-alanyl-D-glutamate--2,6-diaminopimelate ligase [Clostridiales bacterium]